MLNSYVPIKGSAGQTEDLPKATLAAIASHGNPQPSPALTSSTGGTVSSSKYFFTTSSGLSAPPEQRETRGRRPCMTKAAPEQKEAGEAAAGEAGKARGQGGRIRSHRNVATQKGRFLLAKSAASQAQKRMRCSRRQSTSTSCKSLVERTESRRAKGARKRAGGGSHFGGAHLEAQLAEFLQGGDQRAAESKNRQYPPPGDRCRIPFGILL